MRNRDALGHARRSRRVDHIGCLLRMNDDIRCDRRLVEAAPASAIEHKAIERNRFGQLLTGRQATTRCRRRQACRAPDHRPFRIERYISAAGLQHAQQDVTKVAERSIQSADRHVPGHTLPGKHMRQAVRSLFELGEGERLAPADATRCLRTARRLRDEAPTMSLNRNAATSAGTVCRLASIVTKSASGRSAFAAIWPGGQRTARRSGRSYPPRTDRSRS